MKINLKHIASVLLTTLFVAGPLGAADPINPEGQPLGSIGPWAFSTSNIANGAKGYRPWFENGSWAGDLIEYDVSNAGQLRTTVDLSSITPQMPAGSTNWSANVRFREEADGALHWDSGRKIITNKRGNRVGVADVDQIPFRWNELSNDHKALIDPSAAKNGDNRSNVLDFLRGDRSNEAPGGNLRRRYSVLGDIVHSNPVHVGAPEEDFTASSYVTFKTNNQNRAERVYVGSNSGMLHAIDASNGIEAWAYVPSMLMPKLSRLAGTPYAHSYYVDGAISVRDAFIGGQWATVLIGTLGAGGKGLYILDVTDPDLSSEFTGDRKLIGELSEANNDVGYMFGAVTIAPLANGRWYAITGNGIGSASNQAKLLLIDLLSGAVTSISTNSGTAGSPNGLSAPGVLDIDRDGFADIAYAGDLNGDMWRFDLRGTPRLDYKLYSGVAGATQPITMSPDVSAHPLGGYIVMFGTGKLFEDKDVADRSVQALYGIWDKGTAPSGTETRLAQLLSDQIGYVSGPYSEQVRVFQTTAPLDYTVYDGWMVELPAGERMLTRPQVRGGRLKTSITDPANYNNWYLEVTFDEGGVEDDSIFDLNRDGQLNNADRVLGNNDADLEDLEDIPMGWKRPTGNMSRVTITTLGNGRDRLFMNFLNPPLIQDSTSPNPCAGVCVGGLQGGHMDVDTDQTLGDKTDGHVHEYDDDFDRTYVDYFDINANGGGGGKLLNVTDIGLDPANDEFIVLMTNADYSPGGELTLGTRKYNVVEYQRMIHMKMRTWNGNPNTLKDGSYSLVFTLDEILAGGGELKSTFESTAIVAGGLIPTNTGCVNKADAQGGRWRNGSLVFQLVPVSIFAGGGQALDKVRVQTPGDLRVQVQLPTKQVDLVEDFNNNGVIEGNAPHYEIMGGLVARDNAGFHYESTLFWHWDPGECYGDAGWEDEYIEITQGVPLEVFEEMLDEAGFADFAELVNYRDSLEGCKDQSAKKGGCEEEYDEINTLYEQGLLNGSGGTAGGGGDGSGDGSGDGTTSESGAEGSGTSESTEAFTMDDACRDDPTECDGMEVAGPNFGMGRRSWTDIMPQ